MSKPSLLCEVSSPEKDYTPSSLWCIGIPRSQCRAVAHESGTIRREAEVCNREWKAPPHRSSHADTPGLCTAPHFLLYWLNFPLFCSQRAREANTMYFSEEDIKMQDDLRLLLNSDFSIVQCVWGYRGRRTFKEENTPSSWARKVRASKNRSFQALISCASLHIKRWTVGSYSPFFHCYSWLHWALTRTQSGLSSCKKANLVLLKERGKGQTRL